MKSLWENPKKENSPLKLRAYSSRLLGENRNLVLHGGGNTSVKIQQKNIFGETEEILFVKGSGCNLKNIAESSFSPLHLASLKRLLTLNKMSDLCFIRELQKSLIDHHAPSPSVETLLHAIIPSTYVDHTHADAILTITNTVEAEQKLEEIYGDTVLTVPYIMPGFSLAKKVYELTLDIEWNKLEGIILMNHGVFTFADSAQSSYEKMISIVTKAEEYLIGCADNAISNINSKKSEKKPSALKLAKIRGIISKKMERPMIVTWNPTDASVMLNGPLTPDHVIHTKALPIIFSSGDIARDLDEYAKKYSEYFSTFKSPEHVSLDPWPRYGIIPEGGSIAIGDNYRQANIINDIVDHTVSATYQAEKIGGIRRLPIKDIFDIEYWGPEQSKLTTKNTSPLPFAGKVAVVTGAASGIGQATVDALRAMGSAVIALDINPLINDKNDNKYFGVLGDLCDITDTAAIKKSLQKGVEQFGGIDLLVSNAGSFPKSLKIEELDDESWEKSININLTSHLKMVRETIPYLKEGFDASIVIVASKNVRAPGPGAAAYSAAKAGITQLARVAALELGQFAIRVNVLHPDAVFDTKVWSKEILNSRAEHYGLSVEEYKKKNILKTEITSQDVANLITTLAGKQFSKTTGAQIPIDGGNDRVI